MKECTEYMIGKFLAYMEHDSARFLSKIADCPLDELYLITPEYLIPYLNFIKENRRLFGTSIENAAVLRLDESYAGLVRYVITPIFERYGVPKEQRNYVLTFNIQGIMAIISLWLKGDCAEPTEYMCDVICRCVRRIEGKKIFSKKLDLKSALGCMIEMKRAKPPRNAGFFAKIRCPVRPSLIQLHHTKEIFYVYENSDIK